MAIVKSNIPSSTQTHLSVFVPVCRWSQPGAFFECCPESLNIRITNNKDQFIDIFPAVFKTPFGSFHFHQGLVLI